MGIWAIRSPLKIRWYTSMLFETCWSLLIYTKKKRRIRKPWLNARKHWESESRNRNLSAAVLHVKPSRHNSNLYDSRENHHKVEILNYSVSLQYRKRNRDFITINFQNLAFFRESFTCSNVIGFEPWDLFPLTIKCYRKCLQNYKGTIFGVAWTERYRF